MLKFKIVQPNWHYRVLGFSAPNLSWSMSPVSFQFVEQREPILGVTENKLRLVAKGVESVQDLNFRLQIQNLTDSYIVFTLKLESGQNFCSNRWIRSSTYGKKNISDFPPCGRMVIFVTEFVIFRKTPPFYEVKWIRRKWLPHGGISKIFFLDHFSPSFLGQKC